MLVFYSYYSDYIIEKAEPYQFNQFRSNWYPPDQNMVKKFSGCGWVESDDSVNSLLEKEKAKNNLSL